MASRTIDDVDEPAYYRAVDSTFVTYERELSRRKIDFLNVFSIFKNTGTRETRKHVGIDEHGIKLINLERTSKEIRRSSMAKFRATRHATAGCVVFRSIQPYANSRSVLTISTYAISRANRRYFAGRIATFPRRCTSLNGDREMLFREIIEQYRVDNSLSAIKGR